jgi:Fic family protein
MEIFKKIDALKKEIDAFRPISADLEAKIMQKFRLDWNYNSNAIEGNQLTFGETKTFLLHGITADGKPLKDHLDIKGHNNALLLLEEILNEERPITESFIRELHQMILQEDYYNDAITTTGEKTKRLIKVGEYKQAPNHVKTKTGEIFRFASPEETPAEMDKLIQWLRSEMEKGDDEALHPVAIASLFHYKFIRVHPFDDGNGRLARILMNMLLMRAGYPPSVIKADKKDTYYTALRKADGGVWDAFVEYVGTVLLDSMELYLRGAKGESIEDLDDVDKEFELLKITISGREEVFLLGKDTINEIKQTHFTLLLQKIEEKLFKINELYIDNEHLYKYSYLKFEHRKGVHMEHTSIGRKISNYKEILNTINLSTSSLSLLFSWKNFINSGKEPRLNRYNYKIKLSISISKNNFKVSVRNGRENTELDILYYHENIEKRTTEIANKLLKNFMNHIKKNLEE